MKALWKSGGLSAREIHERVGEAKGWAYSTTRTLVERMVGKGLLARIDSHGLHVYEAAVSRPAGLASLVRDFAEQVLELDHVPVTALFAESDALTPKERDELRALFKQMDRQKRGRR
jgi:BlaI family penicillinase repressor